MNQLVKHENSLSKFDELASSPKLSTLPTADLKNKIVDMMQHASILNGGTKDPDPHIFKIHIDSIYEDIMTVHSWLTVAELQTVFKEGLRGKYGEFFGLNYKTVSDWIIGYRDSPERKTYLESKKVFLPAPVWTKEQKERDDREYLQFNYDNFSDKTTLPMIDPNLYGIIRRNGLDTIDAEEKDAIREIAKGKYEEQKIELQGIKKLRIENRKGEAEHIIKFVDDNEKIDPVKAVDRIAKQLATVNLFNQWRQEGKVHLFN